MAASETFLFQKQPFADIPQNKCSERFCNILRKTPVMESLLGLQACNFI